MRCPVDGENLVMADRFGVEIDYCPKCRGVWLDRGELDKIIERAAQAEAPVALREPARAAVQTYAEEPRRQEAARRKHDDDDDHDRRPRKRRDSFLSDLFDF
jgi:Zn-finger nucleic acid-binding protein